MWRLAGCLSHSQPLQRDNRTLLIPYSRFRNRALGGWGWEPNCVEATQQWEERIAFGAHAQPGWLCDLSRSLSISELHSAPGSDKGFFQGRCARCGEPPGEPEPCPSLLPVAAVFSPWGAGISGTKHPTRNRSVPQNSCGTRGAAC